MTRSTPNPQKDPANKPARHKPGSESRNQVDSLKTIKGKNVVGSIEARDQAKVTFNQNITEYTPLSEDEEKRRKQKSELKDLENAIRRKFMDWRRLISAPLPGSGNPYLFMQPFGFGDGPRFFGRHEITDELLAQLKNKLTIFLDGTGKTSLLQARVIPALVEEGHLPLLISVSSEPLEVSIKKQLLPNIGDMEFLNSMSLTEFVRRVSDQLKDKSLFLLIDQFEDFFDQPETFRSAFAEDWKLCVAGSAPDVHWLFSIPAGSTYLLNMFKEKLAINPNLITLQPLEREEAREAMLGQASLREIEIDESVADTILDELDSLNKSIIDPGQLQLVCYMLASGKESLVNRWTMEHYIAQGRVEGILRGYLDRTIGNLDPLSREPAWQVLATLIDPSEKVISEADLIQKMKRLDVDETITHNVLKYLEDSHLVEYTTAYKLSSERLRPSIQEWRDRRAALEKAKEEVWRQMRTIGGSALRGLLGGAIGFMLAYWVLPYGERVPVTNLFFFLEWYAFLLVLRALVGAVAGFLMILAIDLLLASFRGKRNNLRLPAGMFAGAVSFALALAFHTELRDLSADPFSAMGIAAAEGAIWGLAAGTGTVWILISGQHTWLKFLGVSAICGLLLAISDLYLKGLDVSAPPYTVFISGMVMPLFLIGSALWGRPTIQKDG
jgi:conflict system STAND superfamily ATPase